MKTKPALAAWLAVTVALGGASLEAQRSSGKTAGEKVREVLPEAEMVFTKEEQTMVKDWFRTNRSGLPPGLAKRDRLPPGLERQLRERGKLPPGLQKKLQPLPPELERRMRILPTGYRRVVIGGNVILMNEKTATVYDIIRNVVP
jgi:hypothetical protein